MPVVPAVPTSTVLTSPGASRLRSLMSQPLTIERRGTITTDEYGNEVPSTTSTVTTAGYLEQTTATEITVDRETYVTDWLAVLFADVELDASDRIVYGSSTFEVVGSPHRVWNPRTRRTHHLEARLVEVVG